MSEAGEQVKIEPRLRDEVARIERSRAAERIPVVIVYRAPDAAPTNPQEQLRAREPIAERLRQKLTELGVTGEIRHLSLAGAVEAQLTPEQIRQIARDDLVKQIVFNKQEPVAL